MEERNPIRIVQSEIEAHIENFDRAPDTIFMKTCYVCDNVRDHILNYEDEPHLSKTQNNHRRIFIASELFVNFCGIYANVVDTEYAKIIRNMVEWEKYKRIARQITSKMHLELRRQKYFIGEAQSKLLKSLEATGVEGDTRTEGTPTHREERDSETEVVARHGRESLPRGPEQVEVEQEATSMEEINETLAPSQLGISFRTEPQTNVTGDITEIRDAMDDMTHIELPVTDTSRLELPAPAMEADTSIRVPSVQLRADEDDIDRLLRILEDEVFPKETSELQQPESLTEHTGPEPVLEETQPVNPPTINVNDPENQGQAVASESSGGWSLPSLEAVEKTRTKRRHLIIDRETIIHDYAARALQLNRNINIQRVQVFEGPPRMLQALSANHLMTTPGYKSSLFQEVRGSKLSTLYNRHLEIERKPPEERLPQRRIEEQREADVSKVRTNTEIMEEVGMRAGMHSVAQRSDTLVDVPEKGQPSDIDITSVGAPPRETLVGVPVSRIMNSTIEPPEEGQMERINGAPIVPTPTVQQLQGKSIESRTSPPWFISTKETPPSEKYRSFNYVYERLQIYWSILANQGMERQITIHEFFSFEASGNVADFLTVLRVVDKMSIQRKIVLEYKNGDVVLRPFEIPYISEAQFSLKEKEPIF